MIIRHYYCLVSKYRSSLYTIILKQSLSFSVSDFWLNNEIKLICLYFLASLLSFMVVCLFLSSLSLPNTSSLITFLYAADVVEVVTLSTLVDSKQHFQLNSIHSNTAVINLRDYSSFSVAETGVSRKKILSRDSV